MKRLIILMALVVLLIAGGAWAFTWEGELDPNEFDNWQTIKVQPTPQGLIWVYIRNPDQESSIKIVAQVVSPDFTLLAYRYLKDGVPYRYILDPELDKHVRHQLTEEQKKPCMECHKRRFNVQNQKAI